MSYASIDPVITAWTQKYSMRLYTRFAEKEARFVYISSNLGECFQIAIHRAQDGRVSVVLSDVETKNDEELEASVTTGESGLAEALEDAITIVEGWITRDDDSGVRLIPKKGSSP